MTPNKALAKRLAPLTAAEIDAMTDEEVLALMGAPAGHPASDVQYWRQAAKAATDEYGKKVLAESKPVPPEHLERYRQMARGGPPGWAPAPQYRSVPGLTLTWLRPSNSWPQIRARSFPSWCASL